MVWRGVEEAEEETSLGNGGGGGGVEDGGDGMGVSGGLGRFLGEWSRLGGGGYRCPPACLIGSPDPTASVATHARFRGGDRALARTVIKLCSICVSNSLSINFSTLTFKQVTNELTNY